MATGSPSTPPTSAPSRARRIGFVLLAVLIGLIGVAAGGFAGLPSMIERAALGALHRAEARFGVQVSAGNVEWSWGGDVVVTDLRVTSAGETLMRAPRVDLELDVSPWQKRVRVVAIHVDKPTFALRRGADGKTNVDALLAGLKAGSSGAGGGSGVTIDPTPPAIAMEHATVEVVAALPKLPFGLTIPERMALRDGTITLRGTGEGAELRLETHAQFADTTLDPGFGLDLGATLSKARGPERFEVQFARPVRFMLGRRVVGFGGLAWSPAVNGPDGVASPGSFEVSSLQLSVPLAPSGTTGVVAAAATCERLTLAPEPLALVRRLTGALHEGEGGASAAEPTLARVLRAVDAVEVTHPIIKLDVTAEGRHSFEDLLPRGDAGSSMGLTIRDAPAAQPSLSRVSVDASLAASDRLLMATGAGPSETLAARVAKKADALARLSERVVPLGAQLLDKLFLKNVAVTRGEVLLDVAGQASDLTGMQLGASVDATTGEKHVALAFDSSLGARVVLDGRLVPARTAADMTPEASVAVRLQLEHAPMVLVPEAVREAAHLGPEGSISLLDLTFKGPVSGQRWELAGQVDVEDLVFHHAALARDPLRDLDLGWKGSLVFDGAEGRVTLADARIRSKQVGATLDVDVAAARTVPRIHVGFDLPETPVQSVIDAIPLAMMPLLEGMRADGTLRWPIAIDLDLAKPGDIQIRSEPVLSGFGVISMGEHLAFDELRGTHSYRIRLGDGTPGERLVGPWTGSWVPLEAITPYLPAALTTTEDGTFYTNDGVSTFAMKESLALNLERGSFVRGASTITQQLVKNLYLGNEKTIARKLQELFIAWQMTKFLSKGEIMALYLNAIEFAPGIYGIGDASWYYFGKRPSELGLTEAIFLASIIPGPRRYHFFFEEGHITDRWRSYLEALLKVMLERDKITPEELAAAAPYEPHFRGSTAAPEVGEDVPPPDFDAPPPDDDTPEPDVPDDPE